MLNPQTGIKFSDYNSLYDILIPQDSKYRQLNELIDFASIRKELIKNYSKNMGREAIYPIILFKYLLLKTMHPVSDQGKRTSAKYLIINSPLLFLKLI